MREHLSPYWSGPDDEEIAAFYGVAVDDVTDAMRCDYLSDRQEREAERCQD